MFQFTQSESNLLRRRIFFYAVSASDGFTMVTTGLSTSTAVSIVKNGVTPATVPISPSFTHISNGLWFYEMTAGNLDTVGVLTVTIVDALIRTVQLIGYVYSGDPLSALPAFPANFSSLAIAIGGEVTVGTINSGVITASAIASNAITDAKIAADAITAAKIADSAITIRLSSDATASEARIVTGAVASDVWNALLASYTTVNTFGARVVRTIASPVTNEVSINASNHLAANVHQMQNNTITAAAIATDAIDADALATDAVTEIVNGVWSRDPSDPLFNGLAGYWLYEAGLNSQGIISDTNTIAGTLYVESIADALLNRNVGGGSNSGRLVKEALYALRNKSEIVGALLSVYDAGDNLSWTAAVASSTSADPVTGIDP
jgi:hypothetical protein